MEGRPIRFGPRLGRERLSWAWREQVKDQLHALAQGAAQSRNREPGSHPRMPDRRPGGQPTVRTIYRSKRRDASSS